MTGFIHNHFLLWRIFCRLAQAKRLLGLLVLGCFLLGITACTLPGMGVRAVSVALPPEIPPPPIQPIVAEVPTATTEIAPQALDPRLLNSAMEHALTLGLVEKNLPDSYWQAPVTRGELARWLRRFVGAGVMAKSNSKLAEEEPDTHRFADVLPGHDDFVAIEQAAQMGWITGHKRSGELVFDADNAVSRWVLCVALVQAQRQLQTPSLTPVSPDSPPVALPLDWSLVPMEARDALRLALNNEVGTVIFGVDETMMASQGLHPEASVTRAQALAALYHYL
ncbi:MAG: hypothetical protein U0003_02125 [Vampirovibrionales bacterium]